MGLFHSEKCVAWPFPPLFFQQLFCLLVIIINLFFLEDQPRSWLFLCLFLKTYATKFQIVLPVLSNYISYFFHCCEKSSIRKEEFNLAHSLRGYGSLWQWSHGSREMRRLIILYPKSGIGRGTVAGGYLGSAQLPFSFLIIIQSLNGVDEMIPPTLRSSSSSL